MNRMLTAATTVLGLAVSAAFAGEMRTVYLEEFDHYADTVYCFKPGTSCAEWTTGGLKGLLEFGKQGGLIGAWMRNKNETDAQAAQQQYQPPQQPQYPQEQPPYQGPQNQ